MEPGYESKLGRDEVVKIKNVYKERMKGKANAPFDDVRIKGNIAWNDGITSFSFLGCAIAFGHITYSAHHHHMNIEFSQTQFIIDVRVLVAM